MLTVCFLRTAQEPQVLSFWSPKYKKKCQNTRGKVTKLCLWLFLREQLQNHRWPLAISTLVAPCNSKLLVWSFLVSVFLDTSVPHLAIINNLAQRSKPPEPVFMLSVHQSKSLVYLHQIRCQPASFWSASLSASFPLSSPALKWWPSPSQLVLEQRETLLLPL